MYISFDDIYNSIASMADAVDAVDDDNVAQALCQMISKLALAASYHNNVQDYLDLYNKYAPYIMYDANV